MSATIRHPATRWYRPWTSGAQRTSSEKPPPHLAHRSRETPLMAHREHHHRVASDLPGCVRDEVSPAASSRRRPGSAPDPTPCSSSSRAACCRRVSTRASICSSARSESSAPDSRNSAVRSNSSFRSPARHSEKALSDEARMSAKVARYRLCRILAIADDAREVHDHLGIRKVPPLGDVRHQQVMPDHEDHPLDPLGGEPEPEQHALGDVRALFGMLATKALADVVEQAPEVERGEVFGLVYQARELGQGLRVLSRATTGVAPRRGRSSARRRCRCDRSRAASGTRCDPIRAGSSRGDPPRSSPSMCASRASRCSTRAATVRMPRDRRGTLHRRARGSPGRCVCAVRESGTS